MSAEQIKHQRMIVNTFQFMHIQVQRIQAHATIVGDGAQILGIDALLEQVAAQGIDADELLATLASALETQDDMAVVVYDADGNELDSLNKAV